MCLIYNYMHNKSLEDQLHNVTQTHTRTLLKTHKGTHVYISVCMCCQDCVHLSWSQRVSVVEDVSNALQFLHKPPDRQAALIHGDVKR